MSNLEEGRVVDKRQDKEERMKALREDPDFRALVEILKGMPQERVDDLLDELKGEQVDGEEDEEVGHAGDSEI
jgi:hypothetical protein